MTFKNWIQSAVTGLLVERPAQKMTFEEHIAQLKASADAISRRLAAAPDTPANRDKLCHLIGVERWGQSRLRVFLGDALPDDEADAYRPSDHLNWDALTATFRSAREDTIALAEEIATRNPDTTVTVLHNQLGRLTAQAWLHYLDNHAATESKTIH